MRTVYLVLGMVLLTVALATAQTILPANQAMIDEQAALYQRLTGLLTSVVDTCNQALQTNQQVFGIVPKTLSAAAMDSVLAPGKIDLLPPITETVVVLLLDRLKMRNESINQIIRLVSDQSSYLAFSASAFTAKQQQCDGQLNAADERFKRTEAWGKKNFWRGIKYGTIVGGVVGVLVGLAL
jgi:hypothetical protein